MNPRGTLIVALLALEVAIVGEAIVAVTGGGPFLSASDAQPSSGSQLREGGPHQTFDAAGHPALTVDIGYADLTIVPSSAAQIDVGVSPSSRYGFFRATDPITARADGTSIRIATPDGPGWSVGDDRMVTVEVPPETRVTVVSAGDIKATGLRAQASFKSSGRGSVTIDDYDAPTLDVTTSNGPISLRQVVATHLDATSGDRIDGSALQVHDGRIESDGRVMLGFAAGSDTLVTAEASSGKIGLAGLTADTSTTAPHKRSDDDDETSSETVRVGTGSGHLDVHASDGNITLAREN